MVAHPTMASGSGIVYNDNLYGGNSPTVPSGEKHAIIGNPQFANPTAGGTGTQASGPDLSAGLNWLIPASSPAANAGVTIANNGGLDYIGTVVPIVPDIGALQHSGQSSGGGGSPGELHAVGASKCLDVPNAGTANGTVVELWTCTGGSNQQWSSDSASAQDRSLPDDHGVRSGLARSLCTPSVWPWVWRRPQPPAARPMAASAAGPSTATAGSASSAIAPRDAARSRLR